VPVDVDHVTHDVLGRRAIVDTHEVCTFHGRPGDFDAGARSRSSC
jgi:hypothetical protein